MKSINQSKYGIYTILAYRFILLLVLYALCRFGFYIFNYVSFKHLTIKEVLTIFLGGIKFDIVALLYINSLYIILQAIPFAFRYRKAYQHFCKWLFIISNSIGLLANFIDFAYYQFTLKRTTGSVFAQFSNEKNKLQLTIDFLFDYWYLVVLFAVLVLTFIKLVAFIKLNVKPQFNWKTYTLHTALLVIIAALAVIGMRGGWRHSTRPITLSNAGDFVKSPADMSLVLNTPFSIMKTLKATNLKPINYYAPSVLDSLYNPIHQPLKGKDFNKLNVVFLIIESLGKEHIGELNKDLMGGKYKGYTPFIDSLAANSYTSSLTFANGRKSIDALPSIISGIPSIREPFVLSAYSGNKTTSIAKILGDEGYETAFFHGAPNGSMGFSAYTNLAGIKKYFGKAEYNNDNDFDGIWGIWDEPFMQFMANTINTFKQPFFSAFFSVSSHHPFKVPKKYEGKFPKGKLPVQEPMGYTDMAIKKFFATAEKMPWYKNTLFVLVADHATVSYLPEYQTTPGYFAVPILFYYPGGELKGRSQKLIQQIDIMPTVLNYLGYNKPYFAFGFDAFQTDPNNFVINNNDGNFNFYKGDYLLQSNGDKSSALYNIKTDRLTKKNLLNIDNEHQKDLEIYLKAFIQQYNNRMIKNQLTVEK